MALKRYAGAGSSINPIAVLRPGRAAMQHIKPRRRKNKRVGVREKVTPLSRTDCAFLTAPFTQLNEQSSINP